MPAPDPEPAPPPRLLDQLRDRIRVKHYALRTERTYVEWVRRCIGWQPALSTCGATMRPCASLPSS